MVDYGGVIALDQAVSGPTGYAVILVADEGENDYGFRLLESGVVEPPNLGLVDTARYLLGYLRQLWEDNRLDAFLPWPDPIVVLEDIYYGKANPQTHELLAGLKWILTAEARPILGLDVAHIPASTMYRQMRVKMGSKQGLVTRARQIALGTAATPEEVHEIGEHAADAVCLAATWWLMTGGMKA